MAPPVVRHHRRVQFFRPIGRKIYLSSDLAVFYPGERRFAPDVLAVLDVEEQRLREAAERRLAEAEAEIARLKGR